MSAGSPYHDTNLFAYPDNVLRFALLGWVGAEMASGLDPFWRPDVVHAHDWHAGLAPAYLAARGHPAKSVFTVHNLAYQGMYYAHHMNDIELPWSFYNIHGLEFKGQISFLKAGCTTPITLRRSVQPMPVKSPRRSLVMVLKGC
jgi:starch synthase